MNLLKETMSALERSEETTKSISNGADVGYQWLVLIINGRIKDPGVTRLQRLHDYLIPNRRATPDRRQSP